MNAVQPTKLSQINNPYFSTLDTYQISAIPIISDQYAIINPDQASDVSIDENEVGRYSVYDIANWFLFKDKMTHKKLQKLCYYAQAWCYALKGYRLMDSDFQAWVHGPVSPALWEKFKSFGYDTIQIRGKQEFNFSEEDLSLLEDVWDTYGDNTGNGLEVLSHREQPWREAREGYAPDEPCRVVISPKAMKAYYKSIYAGE